MIQRAKTLWVPAILSLVTSMVWRLVLQRKMPPGQPLLNHAGLTPMYQLFWLAGLPLFGAIVAWLSRRSGGKRWTIIIAVVFPAIVMIPLWAGIATRMSHPSASQWFGLLCGLLNWIVVPAAALFLGALPFLRTNRLRNI
ncbi:MAG: hypothetical protein ABSB87_14160 [Terriglobales bacterium]|jgi:hypothetical protein